VKASLQAQIPFVLTDIGNFFCTPLKTDRTIFLKKNPIAQINAENGEAAALSILSILSVIDRRNKT